MLAWRPDRGDNYQNVKILQMEGISVEFLMSNQRQKKNTELSQTESNYVQTFVSCIQKYLCILRAFKRPHVQIFVRPKLHMTRLSCVPSQNSCAHIFKICAFMSRILCVQKHLCPDFRTVKKFCACFVRSQKRMSSLLCLNIQIYRQVMVVMKCPSSWYILN